MYALRVRALRSGLSAARSNIARRGLSIVAAFSISITGSACAPAARTAVVAPPSGHMQLAEPAPLQDMSYIGHITLLEETGAEETPIVIEAPGAEGLASAYARRYGISPELALSIVEHAVNEGIDPELGFRLIRVESVFKVSARGPAGALGLTQLMPSTARALDRSLDTEREVLDPDANLRTGFRYLRRMIERYDDVRLGLLAYNRGEGSVDRALRRGVDPENGYSRKVLGLPGGGKAYTGTGLLPSTLPADRG